MTAVSHAGAPSAAPPAHCSFSCALQVIRWEEDWHQVQSLTHLHRSGSLPCLSHLKGSNMHENTETGTHTNKGTKHCQRHNGPMLLSPKLSAVTDSTDKHARPRFSTNTETAMPSTFKIIPYFQFNCN